MLMGIATVLLAGLSKQPSCDIRTQTPAQFCEGYCTGQCSFYNTSLGDTGAPTNMTLYRLTPKHVRTLGNHNTGDAPGDVGFILENRRKALECLRNQTSRGCFLSNATDNIYAAFDVEIDGQIGPYFQCNPLYQNASNPFECWQKCETPPNCHNESGYDSWVNGSDNWAGVNCFCKHCPRCNKSVGRAPNPYTWQGHLPKGWPRQCYAFDAAPHGHCLTGRVWQTVTGANLASTLEEVCLRCTDDSPCYGFSILNGTAAKIFSKIHGTHAPAPGTSCVSGKYGYHWGGSVGVPIGGHWWSTPTAGQCKPGMQLGHQGCTWRNRAPARYYESHCVDSRVDKAVETHGKTCFDRCLQPHNQTSLCYSECYSNTLEGDPIHNIKPMSPEQVTQPWKDAFLPEAKGGCPQLHFDV